MLMRKNAILKHHGPSPSIQQSFFSAHTKALVIAFQEWGNLLESRSHHYRHQRICQIMLPAVSWVHLEKEISSMPILWRIACRLQHSHSMPGADESEYPLKPRNPEEFDTRVMLHAANAVGLSYGYKRIPIIANDIDIIVLGISFFGDIGAEKLWV